MTRRFVNPRLTSCCLILCVCVRADEGCVYVWDRRSRRCLNTFADDGCVRGTSIAASVNGRHLACG